MNQMNILHRINELLSLFVLQVKGAISSGLYDINLRFYGKYPIMIRCTREVGEIMKYLGEEYRKKCRFYME